MSNLEQALPSNNDCSATRILSDADIHQVFDWKQAATALEDAYRQRTNADNFPPRSMARGDGVWLRTLSGVFANGSIMGSKQIAASIKGRKASYLISLFDQQSSQLLCLMDAQSITGFRTAATSALAVQYLVQRPIGKVAVIGSGYEAKTHTRALLQLLSVGTIQVFSPRESSREAFVRELSDLPSDIQTATTAEQAVENADVVICAARSRDESPTCLGQWLRPGMTVVSIGSTLPEQRELDTDAIDVARIIVADMVEEVAFDTGDMIAAAQNKVAFDKKLISLEQLIQGDHPSRKADDIVIYKSVGAAIQDLAVATMCYHKALTQNLGISLPSAIIPVLK